MGNVGGLFATGRIRPIGGETAAPWKKFCHLLLKIFGVRRLFAQAFSVRRFFCGFALCF